MSELTDIEKLPTCGQYVRMADERAHFAQECERLKSDLAETRKALLESEDELAELRKDKERLVLLGLNRWGLWFNPRIGRWVVQNHDQTVGCIGRGQTISEAIDSAKEGK